MQGLEREHVVVEFERRMRAWGGRPPSLAPAIAANRIMERLAERGAAVPWLRLAAAAALLVLIAVTTWVAAPSVSPGPAVTAEAEPGSGEVVQFWLDAETPVHFVLTQFGREEGKTS